MTDNDPTVESPLLIFFYFLEPALLSDDSLGEKLVQYLPGPGGGIEAVMLPVNLQSDYAGLGTGLFITD